jgi:hypothetical protein
MMACDWCKTFMATKDGTWTTVKLEPEGQPGELLDLCPECAEELREFLYAERPQFAHVEGTQFDSTAIPTEAKP